MKALIILLCLFLGQHTASAQGGLKRQFGIGQKTFNYEDKSRNRKLTTEVWYPTMDTAGQVNYTPFIINKTVRNAPIIAGQLPLILFSHGTGGNRLSVEWLCGGLAKQGYIVAAVDHFGNTFDNPIPDEFAKIWERPSDLTYILNQLLSDAELKISIDKNKIGAAGFSLGGYSVLSLAGAQLNYAALVKHFNSPKGKREADISEMPGLVKLFDKDSIKQSFRNSPPLQDKRIKAVFAMAPAIGQGFPDKLSLAPITVPVFIVAAEKDSVCPVSTNARHYASLIKTSTLKILPGDAGHYVFLNEANEELQKQSPVYFTDAPTIDRGKFQQSILSMAVDYFDKIFN